MKIKTIAFLSAAALALAGCGQKSKTVAVNDTATADASSAGFNESAADAGNADMGNLATSPASPSQAFADTAAASDAFEIATSRLAAENAKSSAVKAFAGQMIEGHTKSTEKLMSITSALSPALKPDSALTPAQKATLDTLTAKTGATFDVAYANGQVEGHEKTLAALKDYAATGDVPQLQAFASGLVPTVAAHLNMAKALRK